MPRALRVLAQSAIEAGDFDVAEQYAHEMIAATSTDSVPARIDALELMAVSAASQDSADEAARLYAAAARGREATGYRREVWQTSVYEERTQALRGLPAWAEGGGLTVAEAVEYAQRGRGKRKRPATGWASLTPTETTVVRLVADGLGNPEIARRMFISARTVQAHLGHVFTKLAVRSRGELTAAFHRRFPPV